VPTSTSARNCTVANPKANAHKSIFAIAPKKSRFTRQKFYLVTALAARKRAKSSVPAAAHCTDGPVPSDEHKIDEYRILA